MYTIAQQHYRHRDLDPQHAAALKAKQLVKAQLATTMARIFGTECGFVMVNVLNKLQAGA